MTTTFGFLPGVGRGAGCWALTGEAVSAAVATNGAAITGRNSLRFNFIALSSLTVVSSNHRLLEPKPTSG
jgi:hypothetical protein